MTSESRGVRQRTRRAIVDAALATWARDFAAPLSDVAERAEVGRSTLHRYFPDRQSLVDAVHAHALEAMGAAMTEECAGAATARDELAAIIRAGIQVGDAIIFLYADPARFPEQPVEVPADDPTLRVVERAQAEGAVAADLRPSWVLSVVYSLIYTGADALQQGLLTRHEAQEAAVRTLFGGVAPPGSS